jgi:hypothetical protein
MVLGAFGSGTCFFMDDCDWERVSFECREGSRMGHPRRDSGFLEFIILKFETRSMVFSFTRGSPAPVALPRGVAS